MKELGDRIELKFGPGSEFEKKMKEAMKARGSDSVPVFLLADKEEAPSPPRPKRTDADSPRTGKASREDRIRDLEARIEKLVDEIKELKNEGQDETDGPRPGDALRN